MRCPLARVYGKRGRRTLRGASLVAGALAACIAAGAASSSRAQEPTPPAETLKHAFPAQKSYSPYAGRNHPTRVYFGDGPPTTPSDSASRWPRTSR